MTSRDVGNTAELAAGHFLAEQGLSLIERNYSCRMGEIDLIMRDRQTLVFVEVRMRTDPRFGTGAETVTAAKISRIIKTAEFYLLNKPELDDLDCRFDVISIDDKIDWIKDAFTLD